MIINKILLKKWWSNNWLFIFIFLFFLYINFLSPLIGDDWEIINWFPVSASGNILTSLKAIIWSWKNQNGRGLSNFLMSYFCYYKILWNFVSAGMFTFIIYCFSRLFEYQKNKLSIALSILYVLSVSDNIRMETYSLVCANIAYIVPLVLILLYLKITKKYFKKIDEKPLPKYKISFLILISLLCLIISTLMENISAGFTATLIILNVYIFFKTKHFNKLFLFSLIFSLIGSIFMFTSPGMHAGREMYNNSLGLFGTLKLSLFKNINLIIFENKFIFFITTIITIIAVLNNSTFINKKPIKYTYLLFLFLIIFIIIAPAINYYLIFIPFLKPIISLSNRIAFFFLSNRFIISFFWLIFLISFLIPILHIKKNRNIFLFLFSIAIFSLIPASLITQTGARIITITVFIFIGISCGILNKIEFNSKKIIFWAILFGIFVQINKLSVIYLNIYKTQKLRQVIINNTVLLQHQQLWSYNNFLIIPAFKENSLYNTANPPTLNNDIHFLGFIKYYQLDSKTKIIFDDGFGYENLSFKLEENNIAQMEIKPLENKYNYVFSIQKNNSSYYVSTPSAQTIQNIKLTEPGIYSITCNMINKDSKTKNTYSSDKIIIK